MNHLGVDRFKIDDESFVVDVEDGDPAIAGGDAGRQWTNLDGRTAESAQRVDPTCCQAVVLRSDVFDADAAAGT